MKTNHAVIDLPMALSQAIQHHQSGHLTEAEALYRQILQAHPQQPDALHLLGCIALQSGQVQQAEQWIRQAVTLQPQRADFHSNLGNTLAASGRGSSAVRSFEQALMLDPHLDDARRNLVNTLNELGNRALESGRVDRAIAQFQKALARADTDQKSVLYSNLCNAYWHKGEEADLLKGLEAGRMGLELNPNSAAIQTNLGNLLESLGRLSEASEKFQTALKLNPQSLDAHSNLGVTLMSQGRMAEAQEIFHKALTIRHDFQQVKSLLSSYLYQPGIPVDELFAAHKHHINACLPDTITPQVTAPPTIMPKRLRVGYLSSDLFGHPVGRNIASLLMHHHPERIESFCYALSSREDALTHQLRGKVDHWRQLLDLHDEAIAQRIHEDHIDILVILAGLFDENRPLVAAWRPAPIQVSFHAGTSSGLDAMDYWLTDTILHPEESPECFTEQLVRLPNFYLYLPIKNAPPPGPLPVLQNGYITFGCFNNPAKINPELIDDWAHILTQLPQARLRLKYRNLWQDQGLRKRILEGFQHHGIDPQRIEMIHALEDSKAHLKHYQTIDIALDTFPFTGAATNFQALWMGVPVVSRLGDRFIQRMGGSIIAHAGLPELNGASREAYVEIAVTLASDRKRLQHLRNNLREQVAGSVLCDGERYARAVEHAYREMWRIKFD
ncbi:MAG: tetratricopeptide repeat protein [Magnetococcales bacterium]|nr:tetratricopeptide repeat protein [Magnetococcales bacterium]